MLERLAASPTPKKEELEKDPDSPGRQLGCFCVTMFWGWDWVGLSVLRVKAIHLNPTAHFICIRKGGRRSVCVFEKCAG